MGEFADLIRKLGTSEKHLSYMKWLLEQRKEDIDSFFELVKHTPFELAVADVHKDVFQGTTQLSELAPLACAALLDQYGINNFVCLSYRVKVKLTNFNATERSNMYSFHFQVLIYLDDEHVRTCYYHTQFRGSQTFSSISDFYTAISDGCLHYSCTFQYEATNDMLKIGLDLKSAQEELVFLGKLFKAAGMPLPSHNVGEITALITQCLKDHADVFSQQIHELTQVYQNVIDKPDWILSVNGFLCLRKDDPIDGDWSIYEMNTQSCYVEIDKSHPRFYTIGYMASSQCRRDS